MLAFAQSFHLFATAVFVLGSAVVGLRLIGLGRRTRQQPELLLGSAILCSAVLGYGVLIAGLIVRGGDMTPDPSEVPPMAILLSAVGKTLHDLGVTLFFGFLLRVFRAGEAWAWTLAAAAMLLLWGGVGWGAATGSFRVETVGSGPWLCEYGVIWTYPLWLAFESFRYWRMMRRRTALGFGDPMVANRFALWSLGSVFTALAIWTASVPFFLVEHPALSKAWTPGIHVLTALSGLASVSCSYLAFLPPDWYARRIAAAADPG